MLHTVEKALKGVVSPIDEANALALRLCDLRLVPPQVVSVDIKVAQDDVNGLLLFLRGATLGTSLVQ